MLRSKLLPALVALSLGMTALAVHAAEARHDSSGPSSSGDSAGAAEAESMMAALSGAAGKLGRQADLPSFLSESDATAYRDAFAAQDAGERDAADRAIARIQDPLLLGSLRGQRILSDSHAASTEELRDWLAHHADHPDAADIYDVARHRPGIKATELKTPTSVSVAPGNRHGSAEPASSRDGDPVWEDFSVEPSRSLTPRERRGLDRLKEHFRSLAHDRNYAAAIAALDSPETRPLFDKADYDELKTVLAQAYFADGHDAEARRWAEEAADRSGDVLPEAHWLAGLSLWRSGRQDDSTRHFEAVANARTSPWLASAGAYWASRANLASRRPELVNHWLTQAASYPRTFYGQLARKALGQDVTYSWESRPFTDLDAEILARVPGARRALALLQIGERGRAEEELRLLTANATPALAQSMLSLANVGGLPGLAVRLDGMLSAQDGRLRDNATYPLPEWRPASGWEIDRALLLAIARQESGFNPRAKSPAGAVGLMQLMPRTAKSMGATGNLSDPTVSLDLGQHYVRHLLEDDAIKGNLLFLAASYNSGPAAVSRWLQNGHHNGDPLLFVESIPARETRAYVERVLTNFWVYRNRLGQNSPSLEAVSSGDWPMYDGPVAKSVALKN